VWDLPGEDPTDDEIYLKDSKAFLMNLRDNITFNSSPLSYYAGICRRPYLGPSWGLSDIAMYSPFNDDRKLTSFTI